MCSGSKTNLCPLDSEMEIGFHDDKICSKLLELAATDDLAGFIHEVEERGCDVNGASFWYGRSFGSKKMGLEERTPLMIASLYGSTEVLSYILGTGLVDVNRACGSDGAAPLHCAAAGGSWSSVEVVKLLIDASGDINAVDAGGKKPMDLIAPCVKSSVNSKRKKLEMLLSGISITGEAEEDEDVEEGSKMGLVAKEGSEKKEYPIDVSLPDINDGVYGTDEFRMYNFKVKPCSRAYSHDWTECPFVHPGENARRRDPRKYHYTCVPCPEFKKGACAKGDSCEYAHGVFESWLHPAQYRTRLCKDETGCSRKVCFFAHKPEELRPLYASTGSAMPSPKSVPVMESTMFSPMSLGSSSTPPMSPSINCSSPMGGSMWQQNKANLTPPSLQLPGSRLKASLNARDVELDMELLGLEKIRTQQQHRQQFVEEMAGLSSPYNRIGDMKPTNLDDVFGSLDPSLLSHFQGLSPKLNSPTGLKIRQNTNQLRASYPSNMSSSPARNPSSAYGFDSSAAVAAALMNSRSSAFSKQRSQSFIDRSGVTSYRGGLSGSPKSPGQGQGQMQANHSEWGSPNGRVDWGFNGDEANKLRKSASFGIRSGNGGSSVGRASVDEPDVSWVSSLVRDGPARGPHWVDQMYIEQEQMVA